MKDTFNPTFKLPVKPTFKLPVKPTFFNDEKLLKLPENPLIVIGSGAGGLMAASLLSKRYPVVVFEQHPEKIGGCLHTFKKNGAQFETGLHYVGAGDIRHSGLGSMLDKITKTEWVDLDPYFDTIRFGSDQEEFRVQKGIETTKQI